jgi:P4 family phage/plasmid primase-like protien
VFDRYVDELKWVMHSLKGKRPCKDRGWNTEINLDNCKNEFVPNSNIGVLAGKISGIVVLDLDRLKLAPPGAAAGSEYITPSGEKKHYDDPNKKIDGVEHWNEMTRLHGDVSTTCEETGSSGLHQIFKYDERTSKLRGGACVLTHNGKKVKWDLLADKAASKSDDGMGPSNLVVAPSIHPDTGRPYKWIRDPFKHRPIKMPDWLFTMLFEAQNPKPKVIPRPISISKEAEVTPSKREENSNEIEAYQDAYTKKNVEAMLSLLGDDRREGGSYDQWIHVGQILKTCGIELGDDDWAFHLWDEWSRGGGNYDESVMEKHWKSFRANWNYWTLRSLARDDNPQKYWKLIVIKTPKVTPEIIANLFRDELGHSEIISEVYKGKIICTDSGSGSGYMWDDVEKIWNKYQESQLAYLIAITLERITLKYIQFKKRQVIDETDEVTKKIKETERQNTLKDLNTILKKVRTYKHSLAVTKLLRMQLYSPKFAQKLDVVPHLLPISDGKIVNLKTGEVRERDKKDMFSKACNVSLLSRNEDTKGVFKEAEEFMLEIMGTQEKLDYTQKMSGLFLTGEARARMLFIFHGVGSNAKSVVLEIYGNILGDFHAAVSKSVFIKDHSLNRHEGAATPHLIPLVGRRLCTYSETQEQDKLNEGLLKSITGGDEISARANYGNQFEFVPFCKLIMATNEKPEFNISDNALVTRLRYVPFDTRFVDNPTEKNEKKRDNEKAEKMCKKHDPEDQEKIYTGIYLDAIFTWMVEGALKYYKEGLITPKSLEEEKQKSIDDIDIVKHFLKEKVVPNEREKIKISELHEVYNTWCERNEYKKMNLRDFIKNLENREKSRYKIIKPNNVKCLASHTWKPIENIKNEDDF